MRFIVLSVFLLAACVSHGRSDWNQSGKSEQDMKTDLYACDQEVIATPAQRGDSINRCMEAKGWR